MNHWIIDGHIELFLSQCSMTGVLRHVLSCLWDGAYKRSLAANRKPVPDRGTGYNSFLISKYCSINLFDQVAVSIQISNLLICFCSFELSCPISHLF